MCGKTTVTSKDSCLEQHGTCYKGSSILKNIHTHLRSCSKKDMFQITNHRALIMCTWICFLQWKTAKFPFKSCSWPTTKISKFLLILHSNYFRSNFIIWLIFLPPMYLSFSPALKFYRSWPSMNFYFSTLKCIFPYWFAQRKNPKNPERLWKNVMVWPWTVRHYSQVHTTGQVTEHKQF